MPCAHANQFMPFMFIAPRMYLDCACQLK